MDSQDSSTVSRDGDDDRLLSLMAGLAKEANCLFDSRRYSECTDLLHQLLQKKKDDPKVLHNIIVTEYFQDGCSDPRKVLEVLNQVKKRNEDLARASIDQGEASDNHGNSAMSGTKGSGSALHQLSVSSTSIACIDEHDTSVATLNIAIILFHLHEYAKALSILEPLYQNIAPIDETTALHICLLLLDVALASHDATIAAEVLQYVEKSFGHDSGSNSQPSNLPTKTSSTTSNSTSLDISNSDSTSNAPESTLVRTSSEEIETLISTLGSDGQNFDRPSGFSSSNDVSKASLDQSDPAHDLKLKLDLYRVRLLILTRNLPMAKREVKNAIKNIARVRDSSTALLLKSQIEYARGNHRKAIKLLMPSSNRAESGMPSIFNNNLACIYHQLKKHHTSAVLFSKALKSSSSLQSEKPKKLATFSQDKSLSIVYNCGVQYLVCEKPIVAAQCFQKAGLIFYHRPLLWLRIAECCLLALEKGLLELTKVSSNEEVRIRVAGEGKFRQLYVEGRDSKIKQFDSTENNNGLTDGDIQQKLSLPFARQCLLNALYLLNSLESNSSKGYDVEEDEPSQRFLKDLNHKNMSVGDTKASSIPVVSSQATANGDAKDSKGVANLKTTRQGLISEYEDICRRRNHIIKQTVLADIAYVELTLENPLKALSAARSLLRLTECSRIHIFVGHMYAAEALCCLNRPKEAAEHLSVYLSDGIIADVPYTDEDTEKWKEIEGNALLNPTEALGTLYANLAATSAIENDLEQAYQFASKALSIIPNNRQAIMTAVNVDLLLGKSQEALVKLKRYGRVRFLPSGGITYSR